MATKYQDIKLQEAYPEGIDDNYHKGQYFSGVLYDSNITVHPDSNTAVLQFLDDEGWATVQQNDEGNWVLTVYSENHKGSDNRIGSYELNSLDARIGSYRTVQERAVMEYVQRAAERSVAKGGRDRAAEEITPHERLIREFKADLRHLCSYARFALRYQELTKRIPSLMLGFAGGTPFQAEGLLGDMKFYFRYRRGEAVLSVGGEDLLAHPLYQAATTHEGYANGRLDHEEFSELFAQLVQNLERTGTSDEQVYPEIAPDFTVFPD